FLTDGVILPLITRPVAEGASFRGSSSLSDYAGDLEIVAGERRFRAAQAAKLDSVPVIIRDLSDDDVIAFQMIENVQREDVLPLEESSGYLTLLKLPGASYASVAARTGKDLRHIRKYAQLHSLVSEAKKRLEKGT